MGVLVVRFFSSSMLLMNPSDAAQVSKIFFGGEPWLVHCVNKRTVKASFFPPHYLLKAAETLRSDGVRVATVHCWEMLPTRKGPRTLAKRFSCRLETGGKSPVTRVEEFVLAPSPSPSVLQFSFTFTFICTSTLTLSRSGSGEE